MVEKIFKIRLIINRLKIKIFFEELLNVGINLIFCLILFEQSSYAQRIEKDFEIRASNQDDNSNAYGKPIEIKSFSSSGQVASDVVALFDYSFSVSALNFNPFIYKYTARAKMTAGFTSVVLDVLSASHVCYDRFCTRPNRVTVKGENFLALDSIGLTRNDSITLRPLLESAMIIVSATTPYAAKA